MVGKYNGAGVKKFVWVRPGNVPSSMATNQNAGYERRHCSTEAEALEWVLV
jgi:hypothetical protein